MQWQLLRSKNWNLTNVTTNPCHKQPRSPLQLCAEDESFGVNECAINSYRVGNIIFCSKYFCVTSETRSIYETETFRRAHLIILLKGIKEDGNVTRPLACIWDISGTQFYVSTIKYGSLSFTKNSALHIPHNEVYVVPSDTTLWGLCQSLCTIYSEVYVVPSNTGRWGLCRPIRYYIMKLMPVPSYTI